MRVFEREESANDEFVVVVVSHLSRIIIFSTFGLSIVESGFFPRQKRKKMLKNDNELLLLLFILSKENDFNNCMIIPLG